MWRTWREGHAWWRRVSGGVRVRLRRTVGKLPAFRQVYTVGDGLNGGMDRGWVHVTVTLELSGWSLESGAAVGELAVPVVSGTTFRTNQHRRVRGGLFWKHDC